MYHLQLQVQTVQDLPLRNVYPEKCTKPFETSVAIYQPTGSNVNRSPETSIAMTLWFPEKWMFYCRVAPNKLSRRIVAFGVNTLLCLEVFMLFRLQ